MLCLKIYGIEDAFYILLFGYVTICSLNVLEKFVHSYRHPFTIETVHVQCFFWSIEYKCRPIGHHKKLYRYARNVLLRYDDLPSFIRFWIFLSCNGLSNCGLNFFIKLIKKIKKKKPTKAVISKQNKIKPTKTALVVLPPFILIICKFTLLQSLLSVAVEKKLD